jgi:hypothetical protein
MKKDEKILLNARMRTKGNIREIRENERLQEHGNKEIREK